MRVRPRATMTYRQPRYTPFSDCWTTSATRSVTYLLPAHAFPAQVLLRLDEVHHREVRVLALGVEADLAGGDLDVLHLAQAVADRLGIGRAAAHRLADQQDG